MIEKSIVFVIGADKMNAFVIRQSLGNDFNVIVSADNNELLHKLGGMADHTFAVICCDSTLANDTLDFIAEWSIMECAAKIPLIMLMPKEKYQKNAEKCYRLGFSEIIETPFDPYLFKLKFEAMKRLYPTVSVQNRNNDVSLQMEIIINILSTSFELIRFESADHISRVKAMTAMLATAFADEYPSYEIEDDDIKYISLASAMHDLGKARIPTAILFKSGKLTDDEEKIMRTHTIKGAEILREFGLDNSHPFYSYAFDICRYHHERWDGKGYPFHLEGEQIPVAARIVSIIDVYDTVIAEKVSKGIIPYKKAVRMIREGYFGKFSSSLLSVFNDCEPQLKSYIEELADVKTSD